MRRAPMFFKKKSITEILESHKKVRISKISFTIRKIQIMDFLSGAKVMMALFDTYKTNHATPKLPDEVEMRKTREFMTDVLLAGVVDPKFKREMDPGDSVDISILLNDWVLSQHLTMEIINHTVGKKKMRSHDSQK